VVGEVDEESKKLLRVTHDVRHRWRCAALRLLSCAEPACLHAHACRHAQRSILLAGLCD
jgi:hypothetical protein